MEPPLTPSYETPTKIPTPIPNITPGENFKRAGDGGGGRFLVTPPYSQAFCVVSGFPISFGVRIHLNFL